MQDKRDLAMVALLSLPCPCVCHIVRVPITHKRKLGYSRTCYRQTGSGTIIFRIMEITSFSQEMVLKLKTTNARNDWSSVQRWKLITLSYAEGHFKAVWLWMWRCSAVTVVTALSKKSSTHISFHCVNVSEMHRVIKEFSVNITLRNFLLT